MVSCDAGALDETGERIHALTVVRVTETYSRCRHHAANVIAGTVRTQRTN